MSDTNHSMDLETWKYYSLSEASYTNASRQTEKLQFRIIQIFYTNNQTTSWRITTDLSNRYVGQYITLEAAQKTLAMLAIYGYNIDNNLDYLSIYRGKV